MAAKLVEIIWINNRKTFIFKSFTETFALGIQQEEMLLKSDVYMLTQKQLNM